MKNASHYHFKDTICVSYSDMSMWISSIFRNLGLRKEDADLVADSLADADACGVYSHGAQRVKMYATRVIRDCINLSGQPHLLNDNKATALVDGDNAMGTTVGKYCMELAIEKAKEYGIGIVVCRNSNHYGRCAYYTKMASVRDMIGFSATIGGGNLMAPWGGSDPRVGNNPFSVSMPAKDRNPVVLDTAMSVVAKGKVDVAAKTHTSIPEDWGFDENGIPSTDPEKVLEGSLRPIADYKGSGMAIIIGLLCSVISDANIGATLKTVYKDFDGPLGKGQMFLAVDIAHITDVNSYKKRMDREVDYIKASPLAHGSDEVYLPGEMEWNNYHRQVKDGIVYPVEVIDEIKELCVNNKAEVPSWVDDKLAKARSEKS